MVYFTCITGNNLHKSDDDDDDDEDDDDDNDYVNNNDIKVDLQEVGWGTWTGSIWLRIWPCCGHL